MHNLPAHHMHNLPAHPCTAAFSAAVFVEPRLGWWDLALWNAVQIRLQAIG